MVSQTEGTALAKHRYTIQRVWQVIREVKGDHTEEEGWGSNVKGDIHNTKSFGVYPVRQTVGQLQF